MGYDRISCNSFNSGARKTKVLDPLCSELKLPEVGTFIDGPVLEALSELVDPGK